MDDLVEIASDRLTARINSLGAELWSLTDPNGREYMTDADPAFWTGRAPLLFPIVGALNDGTYRLDGKEYGLPKHGFARTSIFELVSRDTASARFALTENEASRAAYPFAFTLEMQFLLVGDTLSMQATIINRDETALPFSFGFHPAFAWPLPGGAAKQAHRVVFDQDEPQPVRRIHPATGLLLLDAFPTPVTGKQLAPEDALFEPDALIWDRLHSHCLSFGAETGSRLDIAFPDTPMLGIWQKPGAAYLCIEPWQGIADPVGFDGDFRQKPGIVELPPGASRSFRMDVTVQPG